MDTTIRGTWRRSLLASLALTAATGGLSLAWQGGGKILGADLAGVAAGIAGFYPWTAAFEAVKVFGIAWAVYFLVTLVMRPIALQATTPVRRLMVFPGAPLLAHGLWVGATMLHYPALYETAMPGFLKRLVFRVSFHVPPGVFVVLALLALALPAALVLRPAARRLRLVAVTALACVAAVALVSMRPFAPRAALASKGPQPNVVFIAIDSLRHDRIAQPRVLPHIAALLGDEQTVSFEDHHVGVPRTFPSWVEMLQGRYAARTGVRHMFPGFGKRQRTFEGLGTRLRDAGYRTAVVSDFAGDIFPRFEAGFQTVDAPKLTLQTMIAMSIDALVPAFLPLTTSMTQMFPALKESPAFADPAHLTDRVIGHLGSGAGATGAPLFLTVFYSTAHFPYAAPYPYYSLLADPKYKGDFLFQKNPELASEPVADNPEEVAQVRALYDGSLRAIDDQLGRLFASLKAAGVWDQTIIVVTADHGEDLFEQGVLQGHGEHLRGRNVTQVPFIVKLPKSAGKPSLRTYAGTTRSIDVAATVSEAAGLDGGIGDGTSLMPWVRGERAEDPGLVAYAETEIWFAREGAGFFQEKRLDYPGIAGLLSFDQGYTGEIVLNPLYEDVLVTAKHRMLVKGDHKIIYMPTPRGIEWELYDRRQDPANRHELSATRPELLAAMQTELRSFVAALEKDYTLQSDYVVPR